MTLEIEDVSADDAGSYKIVADNKFGNTSATIALKFGGKYNDALYYFENIFI